MSGLIGDRVFDEGLNALDVEANQLWILSGTETLVYATANANKLSVKTSPTVSAPADRTGGGREVTVSAITDGATSTTGTATVHALVDTVNSRVLQTNLLNPSTTVTAPNGFTLTQHKIGIPDPAAGLLGDRVFDAGLTAISDECDEVWLCSGTETLVYATLTAQKLGVKTAPTISQPSDRAGGGREIIVSPFSNGSVDSNGSATFMAYVDTVNVRVLATRAMTNPQSVTTPNSFGNTEVRIGIPDPA